MNMFLKNKVLNFYIWIQIKIYIKINSSSPKLAKIIEKNILKNAKYNFENLLNKTKI
jgi:hypothetical protein